MSNTIRISDRWSESINILLTGSSGFIGTHLYSYLISKNNKVFNLSFRNINTINVLKCDALNFKPEILIHGGWSGANSADFLNDTEQIDNISNSIELFKLVLQWGAKKVIFISSSWVYGDYSMTLDEKDKCFPTNLYGFSKLKVEEIFTELAKLYGVNLIIVRPFWFYGPGDRLNRFIPTIINKCLKNENIELNPCKHAVNYLYIDDAISGIETLINQQSSGIYNFCNEFSCNVKYIVEKIKQLTHSTSKITYNKEYPLNFIKFWSGFNCKLKNLGWKSKVNIEEGLKLTIDYYKKINHE